MARRKPIDEVTIDHPRVWIKASEQTRHVANFLAHTRRFLIEYGGEKVKAIYVQLDWGKIDPSTAIQALYPLVALQLAEKSLQRTLDTEKRWQWEVTIYSDPTAIDPTPVVKTERCETEKEAIGWACRYLVNHCASTWYCFIRARNNERTQIKIDRNLAMGMVLNPLKHRTATVPTVKVSADRLSFGVGGQYNKPQYFSRG